jgi:hypothetical protein
MVSAMKDMTLHNAEQLGAAIRLKRKEKSLTVLMQPPSPDSCHA